MAHSTLNKFAIVFFSGEENPPPLLPPDKKIPALNKPGFLVLVKKISTPPMSNKSQ